MKLFIGIDDAGRGPVIGPMILAGVLANEKQIEEMKKLGVKDSKMLSSERREILEKKIKEIATSFYVVKTMPSEINTLMENGTNLNKIEAIKSAEIINKLASGEEEVIIDCPSPNKEAWKNFLMVFLKKEVKVRCEHKADINHVVCSAASILAKVTRDEEIEKIKKTYRVECGSGYPSDPICIKFLQTKEVKILENADMIRKEWITWKRQERGKKQKKLHEF